MRLKLEADIRFRITHDRSAKPLASLDSLQPDWIDIQPGEGREMKEDGDILAVCRAEDDELHVLSTVCPHLGCIVAWNDAEKTWDCPCHGSRFAGDGALIAGPANEELKSMALKSD